MENERKANGQFGAGNRANSNGRPRKGKSMYDEVKRELQAKVTITENGKRKRVTKLAATPKQIANQGASGEIRAAKMAVDFALRAERECEAPPEVQPLSQNDRAIVERFLARVKAAELNSPKAETADPEAAHSEQSNQSNPNQSNKENPDANA